jgi:hypothetical protein
MAGLLSYQSSSVTKAICLGDTGGGKTGALASLADAGYQLHIMDTDAGLDILRNLFLDPKSRYKRSSIANIDSITITEQMKRVAGISQPANAKAWDKCMGLLDKWKDEEKDLGSVGSWGANDILVIDSFTRLCSYAMNKVLSMNSRLGQTPYQSDWGVAQGMVEAVLMTLYDSALKCNVIVNCHIVRIGQEETSVNQKGDVVRYTVSGTERGYPASLGKALSPKIGQYFNSALLCEGGKIYTKTKGIINLKNSNPAGVLPFYPIETGLADYFKAVRGPAASPPAMGTPGTPTNPSQTSTTQGNQP